MRGTWFDLGLLRMFLVFPLCGMACAESLSLEEIVVTVQKRHQTVQEIPAAVSVVSAEKLVSKGLRDVRDLQAVISGVRLQQENTSTEIYIRGVGSTLDFPQLDPPTSFHLNGVYIPREATSLGLYDIERVEVLRGPQGTLYGRSSLGGVVNANFARPSQANETSLLVEAGNYSMAHATLIHNAPVNNALAVRLAGDYLSRGGYNKSGADAAENYGLRLSLHYAPMDALSVYLWGATAEFDGHPPNLVVKGVNPKTGALSPNAYLRDDAWNDRIPRPWDAFLPFGQPRAEDYLKYDNSLVGGELVYQFDGGLSITYLPSYLDFEVSDNYWLAAFPANKTDSYRQFSNELRFTRAESWGSWLFGLYQYDLDSSGYFIFGGFYDIALPTEFGLPVPVSIVDDNSLNGRALFGEVVTDLNGRIRLTLGARWGEDNRKGSGRFYDGAGLSPYYSDEDYRNFDFKLVLDYDLTSNILVYAGIQTGFQPGTFNPYASTPELSNKVDSAELTGYTLGFKSKHAANRLRLNAELFFYDYDGLFAAAYNTVINATQTFNADKTEIYGVQTEAALAVTDVDEFELSIEYVHARYEDFALPDGTARYDGFQAQYSPDWSVVAAYHHDFLLRYGHVSLAINSRYESSFYADFYHTPGGKQRAYVKSDVQLIYYSGDERWSLGLWIKNIEDKAVIAATAAGSNIPPNPDGATAFLEPPRTYGLRFTLDY